jgi:NADH-quinone oxidoreductase subunit J
MGDLATLLWYLLAATAVVSAGLTALHPRILYAALALLGSFGGIAGLFVYLSADFLAVTQVAVYIGGILVLILFAVMLTGHMDSLEATNPSVDLPAAMVLGLLLLGGLAWTLWRAPFLVHAPAALTPSTERLGDALLTTYLLPFEVASVLLVAVIIGAVIVVRKEVRPEPDEGPTRSE